MIKPHFIAGGPPETPISYAKLGVKSREIEDPSQPHRVSAPHPPWGCMGSMPADLFLTKRVEQKKVDQSVAYATNARNAVPQNAA